MANPFDGYSVYDPESVTASPCFECGTTTGAHKAPCPYAEYSAAYLKRVTESEHDTTDERGRNDGREQATP